jgi:hypothetical protein
MCYYVAWPQSKVPAAKTFIQFCYFLQWDVMCERHNRPSLHIHYLCLQWQVRRRFWCKFQDVTGPNRKYIHVIINQLRQIGSLYNKKNRLKIPSDYESVRNECGKLRALPASAVIQICFIYNVHQLVLLITLAINSPDRVHTRGVCLNNICEALIL